ncbi:hypothetical protein PILCRDRAFT_811006 [Piloderma croceum F 1598]|uniref:Uncharacterized protein n=1 Tax=Piloderma croceum (strain F 1598) TaxID=765440 RepID=A0A0C3GMI0_PILCF|nr:hypothetical protein PILCRDRAFT_811006 [Piloderma croceum F 1598]
MLVDFDQGATLQHLHHFLAQHIDAVAAALKPHYVFPTSFQESHFSDFVQRVTIPLFK